jgi:predicted ATPase/DNA-binding SARP family transcriptional activator
MAIEYRLLGPLEAVAAGGVLPLGPPKQRSLLAALLLHANQVVPTDRLIDLLWGEEPPASAAHAVQVYVSGLRKVLSGETGDEAILTRPGGYELRADDESVDLRRFERLVDEGRRRVAAGDRAAGAARLSKAFGLWRGPPLADFTYEEFAQPEIRRLEELRLVAWEAYAEAEVAQGRHQDVVPHLQRLAGEHPLREGPSRLLMLALYRSGRQAEALRAYQDHRRALGEELGLEPSARLQALETAILLQEPTLDLTPAVPNNLPSELTSFVGRKREMADLLDLMDRVRLLTVTGIGGMGKTRLALGVARAGLHRFPDGAWIAEVSGPDPVPTAVATALGRGDLAEDELIEHLRPLQALVLLDGCEHARIDCARVAERALRAAPGLRILATSREPLGLGGETVWPVPPLAAPDLDASSTKDLIRSDAVHLFVQRASAARPSFAIEGDDAHVISHICRRLDGIPLAIELAAAKVRTLGLRQIAAEIHDRSLFVADHPPGASPPNQALSTALDWSHESLTQDERSLFASMGQLLWDAPLKGLEVVCAGDEIEESEVLPLLSGLVDKCLVVVQERHGEAYYGMLDVVRDYAGRRGPWRWDRNSRAYLLALAQRTDPELRASEAEMWSVLLDGPHDTLRRTLEAAYFCHAAEEGAFLAGAAAALTSPAGRIGFIGGVDMEHIRAFEAGYVAGARHVDPGVQIDVRYLTQLPDSSGFFAPKVMRGEATALFRDGTDVVFHAAGRVSGAGLYQAAREVSELTGRRRWAIGVDFDEYRRVDEALKPYILTSVRLQVPLEVYEGIKRAVAAGHTSGLPRFDLANHGVGLSYSGGHIDELRGRLDELAERIIAGEISVPTNPNRSEKLDAPRDPGSRTT